MRRKKCDEQKPACRRCQQSGWPCDGYSTSTASTQSVASTAPASRMEDSSDDIGNGREDIPNASTAYALALSKPGSVTRGNRFSSRECPLELANVCVGGDEALEHWFLKHFFTCTLHEIVQVAGPFEFWRRTLPTLAQSEPLIRHAVTALGVVHYLFLAQESSRPDEKACFKRMLSRQYNQALAHLIPLMSLPPSQETSASIPLILVCCLLFVYIETLGGSRSVAFQHLVSGSRVLASLSSSPTAIDKTVQNIATLFRAIGSDLSLFTDDRPLYNLSSYTMFRSRGIISVRGKHESLQEAADDLLDIEMHMYDFEWSEENWEMVPPEKKQEEQVAWGVIKLQFFAWESRFEKMMKSLSPNNHEDYMVLNLKFRRHMWRLMVDDILDTWHGDPIMEPDVCNEVLNQVGRLLMMTTPGKRVFTLRADFIPSLIAVYGACADTNVRWRVISMLRLRQRREIMWDSEETAQFLETDLQKCLAGQKDATWPEIGPCADQRALLSYQPRSFRV